MSAPDAASRAPFPARLWTYLGERFPLAAHAPLTALLCAGSISGFGAPAARPVTDTLAAFAAVLPLFFVMRVADEHKDHAEDMAFRPERPVPRGLVSLRELRGAATCAALLPLALALLVSHVSLIPLAAAVLWIGAMSVEFGVRDWLRAHPVVYLVSHMLAMPLLALLAVSFSAGTAPDLYRPALLPVLALAFSSGLVLEIGRKLWGTDEEREGVETYSSLWGPRRAASVWCAVALAALVLAVAVAGWQVPLIAVAAVIGLAVIFLATRYVRHPVSARAKLLRAAAVLTVAVVYSLCIAGTLL